MAKSVRRLHGVHLLVGVSPEWVAAKGDIHDPKTPQTRTCSCQAMFDAASDVAYIGHQERRG